MTTLQNSENGMLRHLAAVLVGLASVAPVAALDLAELGLTAVASQPAPPLVGQNLDGTTFDLVQLRGQWVLVTFWATWCGPCRAEMPSLEVLHQQVEGLVVLGVSVDQSAQPIRPFLGKLGITFPVMWDHTGRGGRDWQATSIPLTWLVDPQGRRIGVSRGARDWSPQVGTFRRLVADDAGLASSPSVPGPTAAPARAPFVPPTATAQVLQERVWVGRPFVVEIRVAWSGRLEEYLLHPPEVELAAGLVRGRLAARTTSGRTGTGTVNTTVTYSQEVTAEVPGDYTLGPIEVRFTPRGDAEPLASRIEGPRVLVGRTYAGLEPTTAAAIGGGTAFVGLALAGVVWSRRRGRRTPLPATDPAGVVATALAKARRARLDGDTVACLESLAVCDRSLGEESAPQLRALLERARYAGLDPGDDHVEMLLRRVERRLAALNDEAAPHWSPAGEESR